MRLTSVHERTPGAGVAAAALGRDRVAGSESEVDLGRLWAGVRRALPWILGGALALGAATFLYSAARPAVYAALTSLITTTPPTVGSLRDTLVPPLALPDGTLEDALHGSGVVNRILERLSGSPEVSPSQRTALADTLHSEILHQKFKTITVQSRVDYSGSGVYTLRALGATGPLATALADASALALLDWDRGRVQSGVRRAARSLGEQLTEVNRQLARPNLPVVEQQVLVTSRTQLQRNLAQADIQAQGVTGLLDQVAPAIRPVTPVAPQPLRDALLATLLAALALGSLAAVRAALDTTVRREDDLLDLALPTLAVLPRLRAPHVAERGIIRATRGSPLQDALGFLRIALVAGGGQRGPRIVVCAAESGSGTSSVVATLADDAAAHGLTVLIVDAHPPPGQQAALWARAAGPVPVAGASGGSGQTVEVAPRIHLEPRGVPEPGPGVQHGQVAPGPRAGYDLVLVDAPPLSVADALTLGRQADHLLLVVGAGETRAETVQQVLRRASQAGTTVMGIVLNKAAVRPARSTSRRAPHPEP